MEWTIEAHEAEGYIRFIASSGFKFDYKSVNDVLSTLAVLSDRLVNFQFTSHFERFYLDGSGSIVVVECDPWINSGFHMKDVVANAKEFGKVLVKYISELFDDGDSISGLPKVQGKTTSSSGRNRG